MKRIYKVDENGFWTHESVQIEDNVETPSGYTIIEPWINSTDGTRTAYQKAKLVNGAWVEGATAEEIASLTAPVIPTPTLEQQQIAQLLLITAQQAQRIAALQGAITNG